MKAKKRSRARKIGDEMRASLNTIMREGVRDGWIENDRTAPAQAQPRKPDAATHSPLPWARHDGYRTLQLTEPNAQYVDLACNNAQRLADALNCYLDATDYTAKNCGVNELVGAVLPSSIIIQAREALAEWSKAQ